MKVKNLKPAPYNPRKISDKKLEMLGKSMTEFGDLSGIVRNVKTGNLILVPCCVCGKEFHKPRYAVERIRNGKKSKNCCGVQCRIAMQKETVTGENSKRWKGGPVKQTCFICGKEFLRKRDQIETRNSVFCSTTCFGTWKSRTWRNENHPCWRGGYKYKNGAEVYHRDRWGSIRAATRKRDGNRCTKCGDPGPRLHVHHKTPLRFYDNPDDANRPDNLTTLCRVCHAAEENLLRTQEDREYATKTASAPTQTLQQSKGASACK